MEDKMKSYPQTKRFLVVFLICFTAYQKMDVLNVMAETITFEPSNQSLYQLFPDHDIRKHSNLIRSIQIDGSIDNPGEKDRYSFYGKAGDMVNVYLSKASGKYMSVSIANPDNTVLASKKDNYSDIELDYQMLKESGNYVITIDANGMTTGAYSLYLLIRIVQHLDLQENNSIHITDSITFPGEKDIYTFDGQVGDAVNLYISKASGKYMSAFIKSPDHTNISYKKDNYSDIELGYQTLPESGTYTITIDANGRTTGNYGFYLLKENSEPLVLSRNNSTHIQGKIDFPGEQDSYSFNAIAGDYVTLFLLNDHKKYQGIKIVKPDGDILVKSDCTYSNIELSESLPLSGIYQIVIDASGNRTGDYSCYFYKQTDCFTRIYFLSLDDTLKSMSILAGMNESYSLDLNHDNRNSVVDVIQALQIISNDNIYINSCP
jgi:hypothetical protein